MNDLDITPTMEWRNDQLYFLTYVLIFLAAPVTYIGVAQAALFHSLGASATVANLPTATYIFSGLAPFILSLLLPNRFDRAVVIWSNGITAFFVGTVCITLLVKLPPHVTITAIVIQGLFQGIASQISNVYTYQCLNRGMTLAGRTRTLKRTFTVAPLFAIIGSLGAQYILNHGFRFAPFPYDFALLYMIGFLCSVGVTFLSFYKLAEVPDKPRAPFFCSLTESVREYAGSRPLLILFLVYALWSCAEYGAPNLSLFTKSALGREPKELSGAIMAIQFGGKAMGGYFIGLMAQRRGTRAAVMMTILLLALGFLWGWAMPGYWYLFAFALMGAGELGGAYIPNYVLEFSSPQAGASNVALNNQASTAVTFAPALHGYLTDKFGFRASFIFGIVSALAAVWITTEIQQSRRITPTSDENVAET